MKPDSHVFEVFPHKYFKPTYFSLSKAMSVHHAWQYGSADSVYQEPDLLKSLSTTSARWVLPLISLKQCMQNIKCRSLARQQDLKLRREDIDAIHKIIMQIEARNS